MLRDGARTSLGETRSLRPIVASLLFAQPGWRLLGSVACGTWLARAVHSVPRMLLLLAACSTVDRPADGASSSDAVDTAGPTLALAAPATARHGAFATAGVCEQCHANVRTASAMYDAAGRAVGYYDLWSASTMANSARNPYWWAAVSAETATFPALAAEIEAECATCHAPALATEARLSDGATPSLATLRGSDDAAAIGLDGVTCTVCHQIEPDGLGEESTFDGRIPVAGESVLYGPHADPFAHPMEMHSGYTPVEAAHVREAGLCATCHTLRTSAHDAEGVATGTVHTEQSPYLEWLASSHGPSGSATTCQDCHVPTYDEDGNAISARLAHNPAGRDFPPVEERSPYGRHVFHGGNTFTLGLLRDNSAELNPRATSDAFEAAIVGTRAFLTTAATVTLGAASRDGDQLTVPITVTNLTGHKLPTGYPSRRAWLRVTVTDATGALVLDRGAWDAQGRILDDAGVVRPEELAGGPTYPHLDTVASGALQVWEAVLADETGGATHRLLRAHGHLKDDRLLPAGFTGEGAIAPVGTGSDADFTAGGDTVRFVVDAPASAGPYTVTAALVLQTAGARHLAELFAIGTPETRVLARMGAATPPTPETLASGSATLE